MAYELGTPRKSNSSDQVDPLSKKKKKVGKGKKKALKVKTLIM